MSFSILSFPIYVSLWDWSESLIGSWILGSKTPHLRIQIREFCTLLSSLVRVCALLSWLCRWAKPLVWVLLGHGRCEFCLPAVWDQTRGSLGWPTVLGVGLLESTLACVSYGRRQGFRRDLSVWCWSGLGGGTMWSMCSHFSYFSIAGFLGLWCRKCSTPML